MKSNPCHVPWLNVPYNTILYHTIPSGKLIPRCIHVSQASKKFYSGLSTLFLCFFGIKKYVDDKKVISKSYVSPVLPPCNNLKCFWVVPQIRIWHTATHWHTKNPQTIRTLSQNLILKIHSNELWILGLSTT